MFFAIKNVMGAPFKPTPSEVERVGLSGMENSLQSISVDGEMSSGAHPGAARVGLRNLRIAEITQS